MKKIAPYARGTRTVGVTGATGVGKSSLINRLISAARAKGLSVGILAVDPSSRHHGGALLGDRIRMAQHSLDPEVYIRSVATRGSYGGITPCAYGIVKLFDAFGKDMIIVETIGVGQADCAIADLADIIVLVVSPESGDTIQFMKAGSIEIADMIAVNKTDLGGADAMIAALRQILTLRSPNEKGNIPVLPVQAINDNGVESLFEELQRRMADATGRSPTVRS
jgi:LAO/AO transport system kinase